MTAPGLKSIAGLLEGDFVLAYSDETDRIGNYSIFAIFEHVGSGIVLLTIDGELVENDPSIKYSGDGSLSIYS